MLREQEGAGERGSPGIHLLPSATADVPTANSSWPPPSGSCTQILYMVGWLPLHCSQHPQVAFTCSTSSFSLPLSWVGNNTPLPCCPSNRWRSLLRHDVGTEGVELHVANAADWLHPRVPGTKLIEVPEVTLLQQVLAATVTWEFIPDPAVIRGKRHRVRGDLCSVALEI